MHTAIRSASGLIAHASRLGQIISPVWGRGLAHALNGMYYIYKELPENHISTGKIIASIQRTADALIEHQDAATGLWRNVIDLPESRLESSCTASLVTLMGRAIGEGWLDRERFAPVLLKAADGLRSVYWRGGVGAMCRGSIAGADVRYCNAKNQGWADLPHMLPAMIEASILAGK
jgi:rhamnogalacturonyl hydrolase YesR